MSKLLARVATCGLVLGLCVSCGESEADKDGDTSENVTPAQQAARDAANLRIGHVMVEVGHRMETAGRAGAAAQWGLAGYEAHEIIEMFDDDMSRALLPGVCDDDIADQMYFALKDAQLPALRQAAEDEDAAAFSTAFATAAASCNGCHATCEVAFIEVPSEPGAGVPRIGIPGAAPSSPVRGRTQTEVLDPWRTEGGEPVGEQAHEEAGEAPARQEVLDPW